MNEHIVEGRPGAVALLFLRDTMKRHLAVAFALVCLAVNAQTYNVLDYGAAPDTLHLSTEAFQRAVDDCASNGGGTVIVPAGDYLSAAFFLKDNVDLHLSAGATIFASRRTEDYVNHIVVGAGDMGQVEVLVAAANARNVSITGTGTLNCRAVREGYRRKPQVRVADSITGREIANAARYGADYQSKFRKVPPYTGAVNFTGCTDVHIPDVNVVEANGWSVHLQWCDRVRVHGVHIMSSGENGVNADGLDVDGCSNVTISDCIINTGDDALCIKTTLKEGRTEPCRWITVTGCILTSSSAALKIGTESHSDFENITVTGCVIRDANRGLNMIIRDGGVVRNVVFSNLIINTVRKATFWWGNGDPLWFTIQKRGDIPSAGGIENVTISNVIAHGQSGVRLEGFDGRMKNVRVRDFQLFMHAEQAVDKRARNAYKFYGVDGLSLVDCSVVWDKDNPEEEWESAFFFESVKGLETERVKGEAAPNGRYDAFRYVDVER